MGNIPYIAFYPGKWLGRTARLSAAERGVFITLICEMYETMKPLPMNYRILARLCGTTPKTVEKIIAVLLEDENKLVMCDGGLWNNRAEKEIKTAQKKSDFFRKKAQSRWQKNEQNQPSPDAVAFSKPMQPEPDIEPEDKEKKPSVSKRKIGTRIPEDFQPDLAFAKAQGLSDFETRREIDRFRDYWISKPGQGGVKLDWQATWRNWCRKAVEDSKPKTANVIDVSHTAELRKKRQREQAEIDKQIEKVRRERSAEGLERAADIYEKFSKNIKVSQ